MEMDDGLRSSAVARSSSLVARDPEIPLCLLYFTYFTYLPVWKRFLAPSRCPKETRFRHSEIRDEQGPFFPGPRVALGAVVKGCPCTRGLYLKPSTPGLPWLSRSRVALVPYLAYASIVSSGQRKGGFLHAKSAGNQFAVDVANAAKIVVRCIAQHISRFRVLGALTLRG